jgi:hypothetical protein
MQIFKKKKATTNNFFKKKATLNSQTPRYSADLIQQIYKNIQFTEDWRGKREKRV